MTLQNQALMMGSAPLTRDEFAEQDRLARYRAELAVIQDDALSLVAGRDKSTLPDTDVEELERLSADADATRKRIATLERVEDARVAMAAASNQSAGQRRTASITVSPSSHQTDAALQAAYRLGRHENDSPAARLFGTPPAVDARYPSLASFCRDVAYEPGRLAKMAMETGASGTGGGYAVPGQLGFALLDQMYAAGVVWPACNVLPMSTGSLSLWGFDAHTAASNTLYGAISARWVAEGSTATAQNPKLRMLTIKPNKIFLYAQTTAELLADAGAAFEQQLGATLAKAAAWFLDDAVINGTGAGMPLGLLNAPCKVTVAKESGQTATTVNSTNLIKMWSRLAGICARNAVWFCNPNVLPQLMAMSVAGMGTTLPVFLPEGAGYSALAGGVPTTLFGRPLIVTDHCKTLGTEGDVILADLTQYALGMRQNFAIQSSMHEHFSSDIIDWRVICRVGGEPIWDAAYTPANGTDTLSCIVTLATRS